MNSYEHLSLPVYNAATERQKRGGGGGFKIPQGRNKSEFSQTASQKADAIGTSFQEIKRKFSGKINPSLIYEIEINQSVAPEAFEKTLTSMGIHVLSIAENKKGYWIVFSDDDNLYRFKEKLSTYGSDEGPKYDFFNAIESFRDIPREEKIGKALSEEPLGDTPEFIDIELWKMRNPQKNEDFITELKTTYSDWSIFRITDKLVTKSFVLLRVRLNGKIFNDIIELKEIARADRPFIPTFNPFEYRSIDISEMELNAPDENAAGILIIDSGIISNHPLLEKCVGGEENFQTGENEIQDTEGHGTAVAGCAAYGDLEKCIEDKHFDPFNWIFSAKVMYSERDVNGNTVKATYDPGKLIEHQFKDAVETFLSNHEYHIKVVNISLGNKDEVWHKNYTRQLPLAALIDELAYTYPGVTFIVSGGNQDPLKIYDAIAAQIPWDSVDLDPVLSLTLSMSEEKDIEHIATLSEDIKKVIEEKKTIKLKEGGIRVDPVFMTRQICDIVPNPWTAHEFALTVLNHLADEYDHKMIANNFVFIIEELRKQLDLEKDRMAEDIFRQLLDSGQMRFLVIGEKFDFSFPKSIKVKPTATTLNRKDGRPLQLSLFECVPEDEFNETEKAVAWYLEGQKRLFFWYRNRARRDYSIQGWRKHKIYPDFIFTATAPEENGDYEQVYVVETKGLHLIGSPNTDYKRKMFSICAKEAKSKSWAEFTPAMKNKVIRFEILAEDEWQAKLNEMLQA